MIVHDTAPVLLVGGGNVEDARLTAALDAVDCVVAADGGADTLLAAGRVPDAVYGDFDSLSASARAVIPPEALHHIPEQDTTDFDKALRHIDAPLVVGLGFSGTRLDHQLAAFNTLVRRPERRCLLVGQEEVVFLAPPRLAIDLPAGTPFSLFPMGALTGRSTGLVWPIDGLDLAPDGRIGTSNAVDAGGRVVLEADAPALLVILPVSAWDQAQAALLCAPSPWSAHGE